MIKLKNLIVQILNKKNIKYVIIFLAIWFFVGQTYAQTNTEPSTLDWISYLLHLILSLASWLWILLANLAGKFMTNDLVYGSFIHLDKSLWSLWNIMKNFANFILWFLVLYAIVRNIVWSVGWLDNKDWSPISVIKNTLIAWVLIQMSWFLMWAVIDLSTIMTSAIWSFPSQFIVSNEWFRNNINDNLQNLSKGILTFDPTNEEKMVTWEPTQSVSEMSDEDYNELLDTIMPSYDSVSGPLLFIWLSVFEFGDIGMSNGVSPVDYNATDNWWDLFLNLWISAIIIIFFSVMMFLIFLFNFFRIIVLWIVIPLFPIIILLKVFDKWKLIDKWFLSEILDIKQIITLIFKPVLMVWALSLVLVILVLIKSVISPQSNWRIEFSDASDVILTTEQSWDNDVTSIIESEWLLKFSMKAKDSIADIIVYILWLALIFFLVKMVVWFKTGISFIDNSIDWIFKWMENFASNIPIIPIWWWIWIKALKQANIEDSLTNLAWIDVQAQERTIGNMFGDYDFSGIGTDKNTTRDKFIEQSKNAMSLNSLTLDKMWNDSKFAAKLKEWEKNHGNEKINRNDLE